MSRVNKFEEYLIPPGDTILELLEVNNMTQLDLADKTGINKKTINEIIKGKAPITTLTAIKLEYVFNIPASFWNNLESNYREILERRNDMISINEDIKYLSSIPYNEMAKRNWDYIEVTRDKTERVINLRKFFSVASLTFDTDLKRKLAFRKSNNGKFSYESLYCWLRYGEIQTNKEKIGKFDADLLKESVKEIRLLTGRPFLKQYEKMKSILAGVGVSLVFEAHLPHTYVNGISYKITSDKAIIMISDRGKRDDILWFTLFHEIAHLIKHSRKEVFIDLENDDKNSIENEADEFAKNILIPNDLYKEFIMSNKSFCEKTIKEFSKNNNILPGILVGRLQSDNVLKWNEFNNLIIRI